MVHFAAVREKNRTNIKHADSLVVRTH